MIDLKEYSIVSIGGDTNVRPNKYRLLLIPYRIAGTRKRKDKRKVRKETPCFEIGHFPLALSTVPKSFTNAILMTMTVCGMGNRPSL